jgi:hypothetical protein
MPEAALRDHSVSIASARMARRTINIEAFASAIQVGLGNGKWHVVAGIVGHLPRVEILVVMKLAAGNCPIHWGSRRAQVGIEIALGERLETWLVVHILTAAAKNEYPETRNYPKTRFFDGCPTQRGFRWVGTHSRSYPARKKRA